jgi:hypothetical protein
VPRIATFDGISIYIYADDHNPPHVHVYHGDDSGLLVIATGELLTGSVAGKVHRQAVEWLEQNRAHAREKWDELNP